MPLKGMIGLAIVALFVIIAIAGDRLAPYPPAEADYTSILQAPGQGHLVGTDHLGRDLACRMIAGTRTTLGLAFVIALGSITIAVVLGAVAGFCGGWIDMLVMRLVDALIAFPDLLLAICFLGMFGGGTPSLILLLVLTGWASVARIVRTEVSIVKQLDFITANTAVGYSKRRNILRHALPAVAPQLLVMFVNVCIGDIFAIVSLSFLGMGVSPQIPEWGVILFDARDTVFTTPWLFAFPSLAIAFVVMGLHLAADGLRDYLDTKQSLFGVDDLFLVVRKDGVR